MNLPPLIRNLLADLPHAGTKEIFEPLVTSDRLLIERIVSQGQSTPAGEWYCQERDEWVLVLAGCAELQFEGQARPCRMEAGDSAMIPKSCRHRVEWTDPDRNTVWLAVHFEGSPPE